MSPNFDLEYELLVMDGVRLGDFIGPAIDRTVGRSDEINFAELARSAPGYHFVGWFDEIGNHVTVAEMRDARIWRTEDDTSPSTAQNNMHLIDCEATGTMYAHERGQRTFQARFVPVYVQVNFIPDPPAGGTLAGANTPQGAVISFVREGIVPNTPPVYTVNAPSFMWIGWTRNYRYADINCNCDPYEDCEYVLTCAQVGIPIIITNDERQRLVFLDTSGNIVAPTSGDAVRAELRNGYFYLDPMGNVVWPGYPYAGEPEFIANARRYYANFLPDVMNVIVSKQVQGNIAHFNRYFYFTFSMRCSLGHPISPVGLSIQLLNEDEHIITEADLVGGTYAFRFRLRHSQSALVSGVPATARVQVQEDDYILYTPLIQITGVAGSADPVLVNSRTSEYRQAADVAQGMVFAFTNSREAPAPTGIILGNTGVMFILFGVALTAIMAAFAVINSRKKEF